MDCDCISGGATGGGPPVDTTDGDNSDAGCEEEEFGAAGALGPVACEPSAGSGLPQCWQNRSCVPAELPQAGQNRAAPAAPVATEAPAGTATETPSTPPVESGVEPPQTPEPAETAVESGEPSPALRQPRSGPEHARMAETLVEVQHLRKEFAGTVAVADVSFTVRRGEIVGVLGANGAGKTTTIQILLGLIKPTSGNVTVFGKDLERHRIEILQRSNFSSAYTGLPSNLKVWENLLIFAMIYGVKGHREKTNELLQMFDILPFARQDYRKPVVRRINPRQPVQVAVERSRTADAG